MALPRAVGFSIARSGVTGGDLDQALISPSNNPGAVAQDARHIYWVDGSSIARANLDGSGVDESFISLPGSLISAIAVDSAHVYWVTSNDLIGRANLDGSGVDPSFLSIKPGQHGSRGGCQGRAGSVSGVVLSLAVLICGNGLVASSS